MQQSKESLFRSFAHTLHTWRSFNLHSMLEVTMQSTETGRVWDEIIHASDLPELKTKCLLYRIRILNIYPASVPQY